MQTLSSSPSQTIEHQACSGLAQGLLMAAAGIKNPLFFGFPSRLLSSRMAADSSLVALAERCGISHTTVCNAENGRNNPLVGAVEKLSYALGVSPTWLAFGHDGEEPFTERIRRSFLRVPKDPRPGQPRPCPDAYKGLPARVTTSREALGMSMRALGLAAGLSGPAIEKLEKGKSVPRLDNVEAIAKALGVSPGWLAFGIGRGPDGKKTKARAVA